VNRPISLRKPGLMIDVVANSQENFKVGDTYVMVFFDPDSTDQCSSIFVKSESDSQSWVGKIASVRASDEKHVYM
jgi:hypothetical protein